MRSFASGIGIGVALAFVSMLTGCGDPIDSVPLSPSSPAPTSSPGPLSVAPATLAFTTTGLLQHLTIGDPGYTGTFTVSGCTGIVTAGAVTSGSMSVTSVASGTCTLTVGDSFSHQMTVSVSVSTLTVPVI
jgi:hypothetical protein